MAATRRAAFAALAVSPTGWPVGASTPSQVRLRQLELRQARAVENELAREGVPRQRVLRALRATEVAVHQLALAPSRSLGDALIKAVEALARMGGESETDGELARAALADIRALASETLT